MIVQYYPTGSSANEIAASAERAIVTRLVTPGTRLPAVRALASRLGVCPATAAAAYSALRRRGLVATAGRNGTVVLETPQLISRPAPSVAPGVRNLADGRPASEFLPDLRRLLGSVEAMPRGYGAPYNRADLLEAAAAALRADGIPPGPIAVVSGALESIERVLGANLRPGDRVVVEDPGYPPIFDLVAAMGLRAEPCALDDAGLLPDGLERALKVGARALIVTPRAQNPTGAALDLERASDLRRLLRKWPEVVVIEDDHCGVIAGVPAVTLCTPRQQRWAVVRSMSKAFGPDLRLAVVTGDELTIGRLEGRQRLGPGWVSHLLQELTVSVWADGATERLLARAAAAYTLRRKTLVAALARHGISAHARSGLNVWVPVAEEPSVIQAMLNAGWALSAGERYRFRSAPGVRISIADMLPAEAGRLAADLAVSLAPQSRAHYA